MARRATDWTAWKGSAYVSWMSKFPAIMTLPGSGEVLSYSDPLKADVYVLWEYSALEGQASQMQNFFTFIGLPSEMFHI